MVRGCHLIEIPTGLYEQPSRWLRVVQAEPHDPIGGP